MIKFKRAWQLVHSYLVNMGSGLSRTHSDLPPNTVQGRGKRASAAAETMTGRFLSFQHLPKSCFFTFSRFGNCRKPFFSFFNVSTVVSEHFFHISVFRSGAKAIFFAFQCFDGRI